MRRIFAVSILFILLISNLFGEQSSFASQRSERSVGDFEYQSISILPESVSSIGWGTEEQALVHDLSDDALYQKFNEQNSAHVIPFSTLTTTENISDDGGNATSDSSDASSQPVETISDETSYGNVEEGSLADDVIDDTTNEIEIPDTDTNTQEEPVDEPSDTPDENNESSEPVQTDEPTSMAPFTFFARAVGLFPLVNEGIVEENSPLNVENSSDGEGDGDGVETEAPDNLETILPTTEITDVINEQEYSEETTEPTTEDGEDSAMEDGVDTSIAHSLSCTESCTKHVLEFADFSVGSGFENQQITNMQLRISLGGNPHPNAVVGSERIVVEYEHYDYWIDGGVITLDEETSNAINGGYFLFAFPLYSDWDEMKRIKVRLTYESTSEELSDIYVDSVWLDVESIDNDAFNDPLPQEEDALRMRFPELRRNAPEGYYLNFISNRTEFERNETPHFRFDLRRFDETPPPGFLKRLGSSILSLFGFEGNRTQPERTSLQMRVIDDEFKDFARIHEQEDGTYVLDIPRMRAFKPGRHIATIEVTDGDTVFYVDQEFSWGVLALNADKTIYMPDEEAYLQMGVLDDLGHTLCDARLDLVVKNPDDIEHILSTENGTIEYGDECAGDTFTTSPDYDAHYTFDGGVGEYLLTLTATTENGVHTISDVFEVRESVSYDIVRTGPTRIYPVEQYPVTLTITASEDYHGEVIESVPVSFQVYEHSGSSFRTHEVGDTKQLIWDVNILTGETIELSYLFDAPDISPEFYLLGPLTLGTFEEIREWQIASDAPSRATVVQTAVGSDVSNTTYSATFGSAPTAGNTIIMIAAHADGASAFNAPASYLTQAVLSNAGAELDIGIWYANANPASTTYSITKTGGNQTGIVRLLEVSGLATTSPLNVTASNDQTGSNSRTAYTGTTASSTQYGFAVAGISFADNDFDNPTTASWSSRSLNTYTQSSWDEFAAGNDMSLGVAYAHVTIPNMQGATLTVTNGGSTEQRNSVLAVFKLKPQVNTVSSRGNQVSQIKINTNNNYVGGAFTISTDNGTTSVTSITLSESGTTDASVDLSSVRLYYEFDSTSPYDCASSTYGGNESQYGATSTSFSSANGSATFSGSATVSTTSVMCLYPVLNVDSSATAGHTLELQISNPSTEVVTGTGSSSPGTAVSISDTTTLTVGYSPSTPTLTATTTFTSMKSTTTQPVFSGFVSTDADSDLLQYEFSIDDDPNFGSPATTTYSYNYPSDAGWASTTFASGATTTYRVQQSLSPGTTYWWRVRARDPYNVNEWTDYSSIRSITISSDITVPEWFQTTDEQFASSTTFSNTTISGDAVSIDELSTSVSLLNAWSTGSTKAVSAGSNRLLIIAIVSEDSGTDVNVSSVTYGGQTLTEITDQQIGTGFSNGMWVGYLSEAGIASSSNTTITPSWTGSGSPTPNNGIQYMSAVFEGVNQISPIRGYSANQLTSGEDIAPSASTTVYAGDMMFYVSETEDSITHTAASGYTEGTEQDTTGNGFVNVSAYKAISTDGTELPTANWSASGNRLLMVAGAIQPTPAVATVMSSEIDFDWVQNQNDWGEIRWSTTESVEHDTTLKVYYGTSTSCSTIIPNSALSGNETGFSATSSPINISALATSTYNRICLKMTLSEGTGSTSPALNDWTVSFERQPVFEQSAYRWYAQALSLTPTDTWPQGTTTAELGENSPIVSEYPTKPNDLLRLRLGVAVSSVSASSKIFKLQYAEGAVCGADLGWIDVGAQSSTTAPWRGYNVSGLTDGDTLSSSTLSSTDHFETYEEENNSATLPNTISVGNQGEWDWVLENNDATQGTSYCFRMVGSDGSPFGTYTEYPLLVTNQSPSIITADAPFDNEKLASTSPWFEFIGSDPEGDLLDYQIQIDDDPAFGSTAVDTDSTVNFVDFVNLQVPSDKSPFNNEQQMRYRTSISLTNGTTYWWRVRTIDTAGSLEYGDWSSSQSFTIDTAVPITTWFQTTEAQFDTDTLVGTDANTSNLVTLITGSTTGTTTGSAIDFDDLTTGNAWGELSWTDNETTGDITYHVEYYDGSSWNIIPDTALTGNGVGFDTSPIDLIDLDTEIYNEIRIRANFTYSGGAPTLSDWTVTWGERVAVVTHLLLFDNEKTGTTSPTFTFYTTDPESDSLEYQFSWSTDYTFQTGSTTVNSSTSPGFVNISDGLDTNPYDSGETISYTIQSPLTDNTTYWWRVRAKDPDGSNSYSFWSDPWSFTASTTATTSTWFQTTQEQFDTDTLVSLIASTSDAVTILPATVSTYNFSGITTPSATHVARDFEVDVNDPTDPPTVDEIDTLTTNGTTAGTPNIRTAIAGYASDAEATNPQYTAIASSDDSRWTITDPGAGDNAVFWARFKVDENPVDIANIEINLEGYQGAATKKAWLGIWRPGSTTPYWQHLDDSMQTSDYNYTGTITADFDEYIDTSGYVHVIFFNEDDSDSLYVDYVEVVVTTDAATSGTVTGAPLDFDDGSGPAWGFMNWNDSEPGGSSITYQLEYLTGADTWEVIPDTALSGNETGFGTGPINLKYLNTTTYNEIRPVANLACVGVTCPTLTDWTITWSAGFTISGTAFEYDGVSSTTVGTVAVAVNGTLQTGKTGSISNGSWTISNVTFFDDDVVTVFVSGVSDEDEAVAITTYDGVPDMSGVRLQKRHLTIGSDDYGSITNADLALYDFTADEDLFLDVNVGNDLSLCADSGCSDAGIVVLAVNTYTPGSGADITTHDMRVDGTFVSGANTIRVSGSWDNNATTTMTGSTVIFTATSTSESIDTTGALTGTFNNTTFGETNGTATWTLNSPLDIDGSLSVASGTLARGVHDITVAGNLTTSGSGYWTGIGSTTFDGINPSTWTDSNATLQNIGKVVVDGTSKTLLLGSNARMQSLYIGSNDTFDASATGFNAYVYRNWVNTGTFVPRTGTVVFIATTTNFTITAGGNAFYNLSFVSTDGSWSFSEANLSITNDLTIASGTITLPTGTTTISGSFTNTGGTFAHNNGTVLMNSSGSETLTLLGTSFTNVLYNLRFTGSGSWSFVDTYATTSNNLMITQGTVTLPSGALVIGSDFVNSGGTFTHNSGTVRLTGSGTHSIDTNSSFNNLSFIGSGSWSFVDTNVTALGSLTVSNGVLTLPTGTLTLGGSLQNTASLSHNNGTVLFSSTDTGETISLGESALYNATINGVGGGFTISDHATTSHNFTLATSSSFTLESGKTLAVGGTFTNAVGGASTTWTGSTLSLESGTYSMNTKVSGGDVYDTLRIKTNTDISMWNSSAVSYTIDSTSSLYSQDHNAQDGDLYIFGSYERTSGTEYWSYATDFDGTQLASSSRQVDVKFADGASAVFTGSTLSAYGISSASTTIANQGSGTYTLAVHNGTTSAEYYGFTNLGATGLTLSGTTIVSALSDGRFVPETSGGTGITVSSTTIDANPGLQIYRVYFGTTTAISASNVSQTDGTPASYWWFRESSGNIDGEYFDNDTGDPGSVRWDDSSLTISVSGHIYDDDESTPLGAPTCGAGTPVRVVVEGGAMYDGACDGSGYFSIPGVVIVGDPTLTVFLNGAGGGERAVTISKTPTANISDLNLIVGRVIVRHEDTSAMTIADMTAYDASDDSDIMFTASTGTPDSLIVHPDTELHVWATSTFTPGGTVELQSGGTGNSYDGSLHLGNSSIFTGSGTSTYSIGGIFTQNTGATFIPASSTVLMTATTSGKTITADTGENIDFNELQFTGVNGGWNINGDIEATGDIYVATGTVTGTSNITLSNGSFYGNGLVSMGSGTTTLEHTNTLGGTEGWTFANLVLGNGSVVGTTTPGSSATTTLLGKLTIATGHYLDGGSSIWDLRGSGTVFAENGTFLEDTSTVRYSGTTGSNVLSTNYYNLRISALGGSPTHTATGLGIVVLNDFIVGGASTTSFTLLTHDTALDVNGGVFITGNGTLVASDSGTFTVGGSWDNDGVFTASGGTVTFDSAGTKTIASGASSWSSVIINGTGDFTMSESATGTASFTLTSAGSFTLQSGATLAIGGTFTHNIADSATTWSGSTLYLYGGNNYTINGTSTDDTYETLTIGSNTDIRMWNSSAVATNVDTTGSLYSQDHNSVNGTLYIFGEYVKSTGTDYWNYATDFDGTSLVGGNEREVTVSFASSSSALYQGGGLSIIGSASASTTITNQGAGTYGLRIGGSASTTMQYYEFRNMNASGLTFSGTPNVVSLSYGDIVVLNNSGSAITVGGTVIDQNPARTFTANIFATSSGVTTAYNVTATGTTASSWRFTNHSGSIDGESYDVDPDDDPGYIVWDDSAASLTMSGHIYSDEGTAVSAVCDSSTQNIRLVVAGLTSYTTACNGDGLGGGTGLYSVSGVVYSPGDSLIVYIDGETEKAAVVTEDPVTSIGTLDLYENRVIVRHEGVDPISISDMTVWDSSDDADIPFTATAGSPDTLTLPANRKLIVWTGKTFTPTGNVTVSGGGLGSAHDGTLELYTNATFDATGAESHTVGGSFVSGSGATLEGDTATFTFTTSGASRTIDTNDTDFYNIIFNGSGSWIISNTALEVGNDFTITQGALTLPSATTTIGGSFVNTGGSFSQNGGHILFTSSGAESIRQNGSDFGTTTFNGNGSWTYLDLNATSTGDYIITQGSVTSASGTLTLGGDFTNNDTFSHNNGTLRMVSNAPSTTITASTSDLYAITFVGSSAYDFIDDDVALLGTLTILQGSVNLASGTMSIAGSFINTGGSFNHASGTLLFNSGDIGEIITPGSSPFYTVSIASPSGGYTITGNATTTNSFSLTSATAFVLTSGMRLSVGGIFTNLVGGANTTWTGSTLKISSYAPYTINTKALGGDVYNNLIVDTDTDLRMWNSGATTTIADSGSSLYSMDNSGVNGELYIYGNYERTTGTDYWSFETDFDGTSLVGGSERAVTVRHASGATTTLTGGSIEMIGDSTGTTTVTNQGSGTYSMQIRGGTIYALQYAYRNLDISGLQLLGTTTITSIAHGDFELAVSGGSLITLSSTTLNYNASIVISGMRFATTTAITGTNISLLGTTPSAWTFTSHRGNLDGEDFDDDGIDDCGSLRWDDSTCLLTEQSGYRWRNDDGGEGVPDSEWFDTNWSKRKRVRVTNYDATTYSNAVVEIAIPFDSDMQADFDDLRFTDSTGTTSIDFAREIYTGSTEATVWVNIPTFTASDDTVLYMYYGNGSAPYGGVGTTTFIAFDDFEDSGITEYSGDTSEFAVDTTYVYQGTYGLEAYDVEAETTDGIYRTDVSVSQGETVRYMQYVDTSAGSGDEPCALFGIQIPGSNNQNYAVCLEQLGVDRVSLAKNVTSRDSSGSVLASTTISYTTGWYEIEVDWDTDDSIAVSVYKDDSLVATTSATDSSYTSGGIGFTYWFQHGGWDFYTARALIVTTPTTTLGYEQVSGGTSWLSELNTMANGVSIGDSLRPRFLIENTGLTVSDAYLLEYASKNGAPSCESVSAGSYNEVPPQSSCSGSPVCMITSSEFLNQAGTTDVLGGNGTFTPGQIIEDSSNITQSISLDSDEYTEIEYAITITEDASDSNYCFRVSDNGTDIDSYTRVAEAELLFAPNITALSLNSGFDITLLPGVTTTIYATGTVSDLNGYSDLSDATTTIFRSGVGESCTADNNNCYIAGPSQCTYSNCAGNSCDISCYVDMYYHADPTDSGTYAGETWRALISVKDTSETSATATAPSVDLSTLRAITADDAIDYGAREVNSDTGSYNASTTFENIGNASTDVLIEGTNLSDGVTSIIPVNEQIFATSTFTYSACTYCSVLTASSTSFELDLTKPTSTTPSVTDQLFWGIAIPYGVAASPHSGSITFYSTVD